MNNILNVFFKNENMQELSFEHSNLQKLLNDFKTYFKYIEAAGGIVKNNENELLVITRLGVPDLPKGKIEKSETPKTAAIREVEEECGISNLSITEQLQPSYHIYNFNSKLILKKTFWFKMQYKGNEKLIPQTEEDISEVEWCNNSKIKDYAKKTYKSLKPYFKID
jgi:8-oxo-dGTP pyrophosphatase MutT (NUDIX family)